MSYSLKVMSHTMSCRGRRFGTNGRVTSCGHMRQSGVGAAEPPGLRMFERSGRVDEVWGVMPVAASADRARVAAAPRSVPAVCRRAECPAAR